MGQKKISVDGLGSLPHEIKSLVEYEMSFLWWVAIAFFIICICVLIFFILKKKNHKNKEIILSKEDYFNKIALEVRSMVIKEPFLYERQKSFYFVINSLM